MNKKTKCPRCSSKLKTVNVAVHGAETEAISYQCSACDYFEFESKSSKKVLEELKETPLKLKQKIVKLSGDRLGIYFGKDLVRSLGIQKGEEILVSVPDKNHIILEFGT